MRFLPGVFLQWLVRRKLKEYSYTFLGELKNLNNFSVQSVRGLRV